MGNDYKVHDVRSADILTTSYVAGEVIEDIQTQDKLALLVDFTKGDLTSAQIKVEYSHDNVNWFQQSHQSISAGVNTIAAGEYSFAVTGKYYIPIDVKTRYARVSAKGTGTVTSSSMAIKAIVGQDM